MDWGYHLCGERSALASRLRHALQLPDYDIAEGRKATGLSVPKEPTPQDRFLHELIQLLIRNRCTHCLRAKSKQDRSTHFAGRLPATEVDYCLQTAEQPDVKAIVLTAVDVQTGLATA